MKSLFLQPAFTAPTASWVKKVFQFHSVWYLLWVELSVILATPTINFPYGMDWSISHSDCASYTVLYTTIHVWQLYMWLNLQNLQNTFFFGLFWDIICTLPCWKEITGIHFFLHPLPHPCLPSPPLSCLPSPSPQCYIVLVCIVHCTDLTTWTSTKMHTDKFHIHVYCNTYVVQCMYRYSI